MLSAGSGTDLLESNTRKESSFSKPKSGTDTEEPGVILDHTHEAAHCAPGNHNTWNPDFGTCEPHHQVGGDLSSNIEGKEDSKRDLGSTSVVNLEVLVG